MKAMELNLCMKFTELMHSNINALKRLVLALFEMVQLINFICNPIGFCIHKPSHIYYSTLVLAGNTRTISSLTYKTQLSIIARQ